MKLVWFLLGWTLTIGLFWQTISALVGLSLTDERYSHILLIPAISAVVIYWRRERFFLNAQYSFVWGALLLLVGFMLYYSVTHSIMDGDIKLCLATLAVVIVWIAVFVLCFGVESSKSALFPLCFLLFLIPVPAFLLTRAVSGLQQGSAVATSILFKVMGVPVVRHGLSFSLPGVDIEIAEQCSGIRSGLSLFITGVLTSYLLLQSAWRRILFSLFTVPLTIFKNGVRIATLSWLGVYVNQGFLHGRLHQYGGLPVSFMALAILAPVVFALRRSESNPQRRGFQTIQESSSNLNVVPRENICL